MTCAVRAPRKSATWAGPPLLQPIEPHLSSAVHFSAMNECSAYVFAVNTDSPGTA